MWTELLEWFFIITFYLFKMARKLLVKKYQITRLTSLQSEYEALPPFVTSPFCRVPELANKYINCLSDWNSQSGLESWGQSWFHGPSPPQSRGWRQRGSYEKNRKEKCNVTVQWICISEIRIKSAIFFLPKLILAPQTCLKAAGNAGNVWFSFKTWGQNVRVPKSCEPLMGILQIAKS